MGETITYRSPFDGFELSAYRARPADARRGGLLLIQEIFGVTDHIRELADGFAADGYETIAKGVDYSQKTPWDQVAGDAQGAIDLLAPPVFATGFCWGGAATWLVACRCDGLSAAAGFYGRRISELNGETPTVPTILHFGKTDASIPMERVEEIRTAHPDVPIFLYDAGHGFVSDRRADYHADSARLARLRTLAHFANNGGGRSSV